MDGSLLIYCAMRRTQAPVGCGFKKTIKQTREVVLPMVMPGFYERPPPPKKKREVVLPMV